MKNGKRPTRQQKMRLKGLGLNPENWLIVKNRPGGELEIAHRYTNRIRVIPASIGRPAQQEGAAAHERVQNRL